VREMGAGPDILSPHMFKILIQPSLEKIFHAIESPKVLHICGSTDMIFEQMALINADAISVDNKNNLAESRRILGSGKLLFGDINGFDVLTNGNPEDVDNAVKKIIDNGADAIWPGCDIWPGAPRENMEAMMAAVKKYSNLRL